jgi:eukaryotic-like serine/threonine-protein kinase
MADEHLLSLQPGTVIAGRYEVVKCLGAGSMGLVYACRHRELSGHLVAVKVLFPEVAQDNIAAQRFKNEIAASYGVSHPNVVRAYEYLRDGEILAYTMEFVGGGDLADRLGKQNEAISISEMAQLYIQMCSGVQAIHEAGIVHRDLKPENILLTKNGDVKIADFGIARTGHGPKLTEHGGVVGTIDYVSPEYMLNSQVDWRSDIYALGILGYEMLVGESPFRGESVYETMTKRLKSDPNPPSSFRRDCPQELDRIILHAMDRDPERRYQSAAQMVEDLDEMVAAEGLSVDRVKRSHSSKLRRRPNSSSSSSQENNGYNRLAETQIVTSIPLATQSTNSSGGEVMKNPLSYNSKPAEKFIHTADGDIDTDTQEVDVNPVGPSTLLTAEPDPLVQEGLKKVYPVRDGASDIRQRFGVRQPVGVPYSAKPKSDAQNKFGQLFESPKWTYIKEYPQNYLHLSWFDVFTILGALCLGLGFGYLLLNSISSN